MKQSSPKSRYSGSRFPSACASVKKTPSATWASAHAVSAPNRKAGAMTFVSARLYLNLSVDGDGARDALHLPVAPGVELDRHVIVAARGRPEAVGLPGAERSPGLSAEAILDGRDQRQRGVRIDVEQVDVEQDGVRGRLAVVGAARLAVENARRRQIDSRRSLRANPEPPQHGRPRA